MRKISFFTLLSILFLNFSFFSSSAQAQSSGAILFLSPAGGDQEIGKSFTVKVMVNSGGGVGINAAEGSIKYDNSALQVESVNNSATIFNLWTTEPAFSNAAGTISFGGGSPSAYKDSAGEIFKIVFSPKKAGETSVEFTRGIVLANDGKGTDIFSGFGQAKYNIKEKEAPEPEPVVEREERPRPEPREEEPEVSKGMLPPLPEVFSSTHSEEELWYSNNSPEFSWRLLSDLTGVSFEITKKPDTDPEEKIEGVIDLNQFENVEDGIWYFHIKFQNKSGWGDVAHRKFKIDTAPPKSFDVLVDSEGDSTNPSPKIYFGSSDEASGIDYYELRLDNKIKKIDPAEVGKGYYKGEALLPGEYSAEVIAFDNAQNSATSSVSFIVDPLKAPIIKDIPKILNKKEELVIQGESFYKQTTVKIYIMADGKEPMEYEVKTDDAGNWSYFHKRKLDEGVYEVWAKLIDDRGAQSLDSGRNVLTIIAPSLVEAYGIFIIIFLLMVIMLLILYILYERTNAINEKMRIRRETSEVKKKLSRIFAALREEVDELVELADKKPGLSESERRVKEKLQESLDISEEFIGKEVEDIEKEIKLPKSKTTLK